MNGEDQAPQVKVEVADKPWYKKYGLAILAGLGLVLTGLAMAFTGGSRGRSVGKLEKELRDIGDEQTRAELEEHKKVNAVLVEERDRVVAENKQVHAKLAESPDYDPAKTDAENLDTLRKTQW